MASKIIFCDPTQSLKQCSFETLFRNSAQCVQGQENIKRLRVLQPKLRQLQRQQKQKLIKTLKRSHGQKNWWENCTCPQRTQLIFQDSDSPQLRKLPLPSEISSAKLLRISQPKLRNILNLFTRLKLFDDAVTKG